MLRTMGVVCCLMISMIFLTLGPRGAAAQGTPEAREACTPDAMRLCSDFIPDVPKITKCMMSKYRQLSPACRVAMSRGHRTTTTAARPPRKTQTSCWPSGLCS